MKTLLILYTITKISHSYKEYARLSKKYHVVKRIHLCHHKKKRTSMKRIHFCQKDTPLSKENTAGKRYKSSLVPHLQLNPELQSIKHQVQCQEEHTWWRGNIPSYDQSNVNNISNNNSDTASKEDMPEVVVEVSLLVVSCRNNKGCPGSCWLGRWSVS